MSTIEAAARHQGGDRNEEDEGKWEKSRRVWWRRRQAALGGTQHRGQWPRVRACSCSEAREAADGVCSLGREQAAPADR